MEPTCLLQARGIGRRDARTKTQLLHDISLCLAPAERLAVVGPSGSGKSLLLRALAAIDPLDAGELLWRGEPIADAAIPVFRSQTIYVSQRPALFEGSVEDNLTLPYCFSANRGREYDHGRAVRLLEQLGRNATFLKKPALDLSGGEAQIVALVRALQFKAPVYLFDEPTAAMDRAAAGKAESMIHAWFKELGGRGAYIWVSHDHEQTHRMAERVLAINHGQLTQES